MRIFVLSLTLGGLLAQAAFAADACRPPAACTEVQTCGSAGCCSHCGSGGPCEKQCRIVCEMKEIKKTVWVVTCSETCPLLPRCGHGCSDCGTCQSCRGGEPACDEGVGKKCDPCAVENNKRYVPPKCGKVREVKKLEKKEVVCKVPVYKCVVVYTCTQCSQGPCNEAAPTTPDGQTPAAPAPEPAKTTMVTPLLQVAGDSLTP